ncbi:MAG TPA: sulfotransferase [Rhizomicrobium sp.]|jgi:Tfp pilus assembly protein PilF
MSQLPEFGAQSTAEAVRAVAAAIAASDYPRASRLAEGAMAQGHIHPTLLNARAIWLEHQGRDEEALALFQRARALTTKDARLLNAIGLCLTRLYRLEEAIEVFDEAIRIEPGYAATHQRKAVVLGMAGLPKEAEQAQKRAVQLDPRNHEALAGLASIAARKGDVDSARDYAQRALRGDPNNATAQAALALGEIARGDFHPAEQRLLPLFDGARLTGHARAVLLGLLGDALDGQGRFAEAFAAYRDANDCLKTMHAPRFVGKPGVTDIVETLIGHLETTDPATWTLSGAGDDVAGGPRRHVFLLGFHRSGTTLLEQILEGHPDVVTLEERDFLAEPAEQYLTGQTGLDRLAALEGPALEHARTAYWQRVQKFGLDVSGKVFVDKHPFNTIKLPLILKLFPKAKVLFALRDPRDVVLSCFRRHFEINAVMFEYLTLEGLAHLYDRVMCLGALCRRKLPLPFLEHRYEDMVGDFDTSVRRVCDFLEVPWSESVRDFSATASGLDIRSPSAGQVRRGLYGEGVGQWRRYATEMAPVLPRLQTWIDAYGYPAE